MTYSQTARSAERRAPVWRSGAVAGVVGGVCYSGFIEVINTAAHGAGAFFVPLRQIGAVVLGPSALLATFDVLTATVTGTALHLTISALFGILLARVATWSPTFRASHVIGLGLVAGLAFYALDVFVLFPAAFPWFRENDRVTQSLGHGLFGTVTGAWLAWRLPSISAPSGGLSV